MAGSGVQIGQHVLILYNDSSPYQITSLGVSSKGPNTSDWIVPGYYYSPGRCILLIQLTTYRSVLKIILTLSPERLNPDNITTVSIRGLKLCINGTTTAHYRALHADAR